MTMADFAKAQLMKYGWTEGKGLGKNENGITEPIRPNLKYDTAGIGHRHTDTSAWWECAFNKAAKSISVELRCNEVTISSACETEQTDVPSNGIEAKEEGNGLKQYNNFLKTSTLCNGNLVHEPGSDFNKAQDESEGFVHIPLTDEELFKACGGRTAHKGARHGLRLNGKLDRIAQQEKDLLSSSSSSSSCSGSRVSACCTDASLTVKSKKSNKIRTEVVDRELEEIYGDDCETLDNANNILPMPPSEPVTPLPKSKNGRKKQKKRMANLMHQLTVSCNISDTDRKCEAKFVDIDKKKCLKRKRSKDRRARAESNVSKDALSEEIDDEVSQIPLPLNDEPGKGKKKREKAQKRAMSLIQSKKRKNQSSEEIGPETTQINPEEELILYMKKAKKLQEKVVDLAGKLNTVSLNESSVSKDGLSEDVDRKIYEITEISLPLNYETGKGKKKKQKSQKRAMGLVESKKRKNHGTGEVDADITQTNNEEELILYMKKSKKLQEKVVDLAGKLNTFSLNEEQTDKEESKRSKRKNKKKTDDHKVKGKIRKRGKARENNQIVKLEWLATKSLMTANLTIEEEKCSGAKAGKKLDSIVKNLMAVNLTENVTASVTGNTKKKKKQKKESRSKSKDTDVNDSFM